MDRSKSGYAAGLLAVAAGVAIVGYLLLRKTRKDEVGDAKTVEQAAIAEVKQAPKPSAAAEKLALAPTPPSLPAAPSAVKPASKRRPTFSWEKV